MRGRYYWRALTKGAWQRGIVLQYLAASGRALTRHQMAAALLLEQTTLSKRLVELIEIGAVGVERGRDRLSYYFATQIVRMAAA